MLEHWRAWKISLSARDDGHVRIQIQSYLALQPEVLSEHEPKGYALDAETAIVLGQLTELLAKNIKRMYP